MKDVIPCYVIARDILSYLENILPQIERLGMVPIILDNYSSYGPLLDFYQKCPYKVVISQGNGGPHELWNNFPPSIKGWYAVTDPDLDLSKVPKDFVKKSQRLFTSYNWTRKVGVSLEIKDIPRESLSYEVVRAYETGYWRDKVDDGFIASTETTLALYHVERDKLQQDFYKSIRLDRPYTARHLPWYFTDKSQLSKEYQYYLERINNSPHYGNIIKES